jgi:putative oxidoreductase
MSIFDRSPSPWTARMWSIVRIVTGLIFITIGTSKVFQYPPLPPGTPAIPLMSQIGIGGLMEVIGGALIVLGLFTRPVAFLLAGEMAVAYFQFHAPMGFYPTVNQGVSAVLYCFLFLYMMLAGAGPWSIDAVLARRRR